MGNCGGWTAPQHREYGSAPGAPGQVFRRLGLRTPTLRCGHLSGPSRTRGGFFDFEVGGHDGAHKGRVHGKLFDCQQSYNVLVLRVPGLELFGGKALW